MTDAPRSDSEALRTAERAIGHRFSDRTLLARALTHPSATQARERAADYERLEFLGDAVLAFIVVDEVYRRFPHLSEGAMTKIKITAVAGDILASAADKLGLAALIQVGESEKGTGSRGMRSALENAFEALVGAVYLDGGLEAARTFVTKTLGDRISPEAAESLDLEHPKSRLQEIVQARGETAAYRIVAEEGPPHARRFTAEVAVGDEVLGAGSGATKKEAEMGAARAALKRIVSR